MPTTIVFGQNELENINQYVNNRKALLITSKGFVSRGVVKRIEKKCTSIIHIVDNINSHPEFVDLENIYNEVKVLDYDLIIAIGGGSVLDASKFISVQNTKKEFSFVKSICKNEIPKEGYTLTPIISIPTTAGTGSEITPWATIWDMNEKKKYSLHLPDLFSEIAIYDPILTLSVPKDITIQTGLDALSHALESIWNKNANEITISYAIQSSKLIVQYLLLLANNLDSIEYREKVMKACMYAGLAFSNTQTALAHAISYYITAHKGVPHGIACSFTLPMLIDNIIGKYSFIDESLNEIFGEVSSMKLRSILKQLNISTEFSNYSISNEEVTILKESLFSNPRAGNSLVKVF